MDRSIRIALGLAAIVALAAGLAAWAADEEPARPVEPPPVEPAGAEPESPAPATTQWANPEDDPLWKLFGPQPSVGKGKELDRRCRADEGQYWLYVPVNYDKQRRYPLVVSLHGMKPYDVAFHHVRMWGALADKHRYLVLAPYLMTSDSFGQFPLRRMGETEQKDVKHVLACMDEVMADWAIDRGSVLLSSWSMGDYLAHYVAVEHGDRFAAFAPLQSNFSAEVLNAEKARRWAGRLPVFMHYGAEDLAVVTDEAKSSIEWYRKLGFDVQVKELKEGHVRHPELAARFLEAVLDRRTAIATTQPDRVSWHPVEIVITPQPARAPGLAQFNFRASVSSRIGEVESYRWDFGPLGGPSVQQSPSVLIRRPGAYVIKLAVTDKSGRIFRALIELAVPPPTTQPGR